ncbi:hypothetical protein BY996DRAFT_4582534 [Phakopsora pachyrhizi]|nr:hypothetical protein BY996DRAFT_4582534 [Phakopsora pachyrhizi]
MIDLKDWGSGFGLIFPKVGSKRWAQLYPASKPSGPRPRQPWVDRYDHLISISSPNRSDSPLYHALVTPRARLSLTSGLAEYPDGIDLGSSGICSYRRKSCLRDLSSTSEGGEVDGLADIWFGRPKTWSINFDDGPLPPSESLYQFLDLHQQKATHFWIGSNVRDYPQLAIRAMERGDHLAVHTWSHAHLTTLSDLEIVGELGWTIQIIFDLTGIVPLYYRPPYGDVDNRVRAIAKHVFGLKTLMWNCDSSDWTLNQTYAIGDFVDPPMGGFGLNQSVDQIRSHQRSITNQKDGDDVVPGKIILEHELSLESVEAFRVTYEGLERFGWATCTVADCIGSDWYQQK